MSYANMIMYGAVLPSYKGRDKDGNGKDSKQQEEIKVDDPRNRERARQILESLE